MRILFLSTVLPGPPSSGGEVVTQAFAGGLRSLGHDVPLLGYRRAGTRQPARRDDIAVADRHIETDAAGARPVLWVARALLTRRPYSEAKYVTRAYAQAVAGQLSSRPPDLVVIDHAQMGWAVPTGGFPAPHVYLAHNVEHRLYGGLAAPGGIRGRANLREAALIRRAEERLCREARAVWALTADDAAALAAMGAGERAAHFDVPAAQEPPPPGAARCDVGVLGSWTWSANAAGLGWFLGAVRPLLPEGMGVEVAGAGSAEVAAGVAGVSARGRVPDAMAFLQSARVVAVPSVTGSGVQVKTLDAIASGRRVVATETAMRGIAASPSTVSVVADGDAAAFAAAVRDAVAAGATGEATAAAREWAQARRARFLDQLRASAEAIA